MGLYEIMYASEVIGSDIEDLHIKADNLLLKFIADKEITDTFEAIRKWYS